LINALFAAIDKPEKRVLPQLFAMLLPEIPNGVLVSDHILNNSEQQKGCFH